MRIRLLTCMAVVAVSAPAAAQQKVDMGRAAAPAVSLRLFGALGHVVIAGWDRDSVAVLGALTAGSRIDGGAIGKGLATGMKYYVETSDETAAQNNHIELRVPRNARVWIKAGSAEIDASGVTGGLDLNIIGGSVKVTGKPRELIVESMDGGVTFTGSAEYARIKTATGDIQWEGAGDDVSLTTVSGAIRVGEGILQRARFESVTGGITFAGDVARGGDARFDTHSGSIELRFAKNAAVEVDASSVTGGIENTWTRARPAVGHEGRGMELGTSSGERGGRVLVRSFKGSIRLSVR